MPIFNLKTNLPTLFGMGEAFEMFPENIGDLTPLDPGASAAPLLASTGDMNGDSLPDLIFGAPGDDDKDIDAGRIFVLVSPPGGGTTTHYGAATGQFIIDGVFAGDRAGAAVGGIADLNGDARGDILIGAPGSEIGAATDAGAAYVIWGQASGGVDLADPFSGGGKGFVMKGQAAGDAAGTTIQAITDLNGDGKADILVGAPGQDAGGAQAGAVYVVFGKSTSSIVNLASVASGTGGFRIIGDRAGDMAGSAIGTVGDLNGDGKAEILVGTTASQSGGADSGAVYVVFGKASTTAVDLTNVAAGTGGFVIRGVSGDMAGASVSGIGDVNGDGRADILVGAPGSDSAYVVFGKASTSAVDLADVRNGIGGFRILAEQPGDLVGMSVTGGQDLNHDGIADIVIGAPHESEGGYDAGAVYVIWGGGNASIDLTAISASMGGVKIVGDAGSLLGTTVVLTGDLNGDGTADLMLGSSGGTQSQWVINASADWQPDNNVYGTEGDDVIGAGYGSGAHVVGESDDNVIALGGNDVIGTGGGNDTIDGGAGDDAMDGGAGDDTYYVDSGADTVNELAAGGTDTVIADSDYALGDNVENLVLIGYGMTGTGNDSANHITGTDGADVIDGAGGADTLDGGFGDDLYVLDDAGDVIVEGASGGIDTVQTSLSGYVLASNVENLTMTGMGQAGTGNALANSITGTDGSDTLDGAGGNDVLSGGLGDDAYVVDSALDQIVEGASAGIDSVTASVDYVLGAGVENLALTGAARSAKGNTLANSLTGTTGNDTLDGAAGADTMAGGLGDDIYRVDNAGDVVTELAGEGTDTIKTSLDYTLGDGSSVENLTLVGGAHVATGNSGNNVLTGGTGADTLDGGAGIDTLVGGAGNDTYRVDSTTDVIVEQAAGGTDTIESSVDFALANGSNVENLTLTGSGHYATGNDDDNVLTGGAGADTLEGGLGNDTLNGGAGADIMIGGAGNDAYYIDNAADTVVESTDGGVDTVVVDSDWTLADNIENVTLVGTGHTLTGNAAANTLTGDVGDDRLDGGEGDDTEIGGDGDDVLVSGSGRDTLVGGSGDDVYEIHGGAAHIEDFQGYDTLDASDATGDSHIDLSGDSQTEIEGQICDFSTGGTVTGALNVQFLQDLTGSFADDIANVRTLVPQIVTALQGISGGAAFGVSTFRDKAYGAFGGAGDWVYQTSLAIGATSTALTAAYAGFVASNGADEPESQIEALLQLAVRGQTPEVGFQNNSARFVVLFTDAHYHTAADGTAAGILTPNNGDAIINNGGLWENYPLVSQVKAALEGENIIPIFAVTAGLEATYQGLVTELGRGTVVTLSANSSNIVSAITAGLTAATTTHISAAVGGAGNDTIIGNVSDNDLTGGLGNDFLTGGYGNDRLHGGLGTDRAIYSGAITDYTITDNGDGTVTIADHRAVADGTDTLDGIELLSIGGTLYTIAGVAVTDPTVVTTAADRVLVTTGLASALDARALLANDTVTNGEALNVTAVSNVTGGTVALVDGKLVITAGGAAGFDYVATSTSGATATGHVTVATVATTAGPDRVTASVIYNGADLVGQNGDDVLTGNAGIDRLIGGVGNDRLNGGAGGDTLIGGIGHDTYVVDNLADMVTEGVGEGIDIVSATVSYTLGANVEKLTLTGLGNIDGTGNDLVNTLYGNAGANSLSGLGGNDTLTGNAGDDALNGGDGDDVLNGGDGTDTLIGGAGADRFNGGLGADSMSGGIGNDVYTVDDTGDVVIEALDEGIDTVTASVGFTLGANIEKLTLSGATDIGGAGNDLANTLTGNTGANSLHGLNGNDILNGGLGNDSLFGDGGNDSLTGGDGDDILSGGAGADTLTGGIGADSFSFDVIETAANRDRIKDFQAGTDHLLIDHTVFTAFATHGLGALNPGDIAFGTAATTADQHLVYNQVNGSLYYDADGVGGAAQIQIATLANLATLTNADFILI